MHVALSEVAATQNVPVVDVRRLIEKQTPDGIPGAEWLMDHVHPTITGHQAIAQALLEQLVQMDVVQPRAAWDGYRQEAYRNHVANLDTPYFVRGKERLEGQRLWTTGRARKLYGPAPGKSE